jgi:Polysaccharide deacetylase
MQTIHNFKRGAFTVSLDFELIWGRLDKPDWRNFRSICRSERDEVVGRLLDLFHAYRIPATWCTVGQLFLDPNDRDNLSLPGSNLLAKLTASDAPLLYGRDLIRQIQQCPTWQEIGCHTFSHADFATCSRERAEAELAACVKAARAMNVNLKSFVFPRNRVGHLDLLPKYGFTVFRGPDPMWHESAQVRGWRHRAGHLLDIARAADPPVVDVQWNANGLWDVKGSMLYTPSYGFRQHIPVNLRVHRAKKGLRSAVQQRRLFHLWFHPTDVVVRQDKMFDGLRQIFEEVANLRSAGALEVMALGDVPRLRTALEPLPEGLAVCA